MDSKGAGVAKGIEHAGVCAIGGHPSTILALIPGSYIATVTAIGPGGSTQSAPSPQFTR